MDNAPSDAFKLRYALGRVPDAVELHSEEARRQVEQEADGLVKWNAHNGNLTLKSKTITYQNQRHCCQYYQFGSVLYEQVVRFQGLSGQRMGAQY